MTAEFVDGLKRQGHKIYFPLPQFKTKPDLEEYFIILTHPISIWSSFGEIDVRAT